MNNFQNILKKTIEEIKEHFKKYNLKIIRSGSRKYKIDYNILNSERFQSDLDINFILDFNNVQNYDTVKLYKQKISEIYIIIKKNESSNFKIKKYPGLIRIKFNNKIYDLSFLWVKNKKYFSLDNMYGNIKEIQNFDFEKIIKNFIKNTQFGQNTLIYLKTFVAIFRIFEYRLPKGTFLSLLVIKFYDEKQNLENTIFYTIKNIYIFLKKNSNIKELSYLNFSVKVKFSLLEINAFISILKKIIDQSKISSIYNK